MGRPWLSSIRLEKYPLAPEQRRSRTTVVIALFNSSRDSGIVAVDYGLLALVTVAFVAASLGPLRSFAQRYEFLLVG